MTNQLKFAVGSPVKDIREWRKSVYDDLIRDAILRLEKTTDEWLPYVLESHDIALQTRINLVNKFARKLGKKAVWLRVVDNILYIRRGPNYVKKIDV